LALLADDDARTRGLDGDVHLLRRALDLDTAHRSILQLLGEELAHAEVRVHVYRELLLARVPLRHPVAGDAGSNAVRVDFLTDAAILLAGAQGDGDVTIALDDARTAPLGLRAEALEHRRRIHVDARHLEIIDIEAGVLARVLDR